MKYYNNVTLFDAITSLEIIDMAKIRKRLYTGSYLIIYFKKSKKISKSLEERAGCDLTVKVL